MQSIGGSTIFLKTIPRRYKKTFLPNERLSQGYYYVDLG